MPPVLQTERDLSRVEADLDRAERLASLLTLSSEAMLVWHLDEGIEFWNTGAERLYGFTSEEAVGRTSHALLQTKFPVEFIDLITRLRNERHWSGELRHICKDGREVIVESRQQLLSDGTVIEAIATLLIASKSKTRFMIGKSNCSGWRQLFSRVTTQLLAKISTALSPAGTKVRSGYSVTPPRRP